MYASKPPYQPSSDEPHTFSAEPPAPVAADTIAFPPLTWNPNLTPAVMSSMDLTNVEFNCSDFRTQEPSAPADNQPPSQADPAAYFYQQPDKQSSSNLSTSFWEDEGTLCYLLEVNGISVTRRQDNDMVNGTKLLNVTGMSRGKRDGILKNEMGRVVVKVGAMHLKGVWITISRARALATQFQIDHLLQPLLTDEPDPTFFAPPTPFPPMDNPSSLYPPLLPYYGTLMDPPYPQDMTVNSVATVTQTQLTPSYQSQSLHATHHHSHNNRFSAPHLYTDTHTPASHCQAYPGQTIPTTMPLANHRHSFPLTLMTNNHGNLVEYVGHGDRPSPVLSGASSNSSPSTPSPYHSFHFRATTQMYAPTPDVAMPLLEPSFPVASTQPLPTNMVEYPHQHYSPVLFCHPDHGAYLHDEKWHRAPS